MNKGRLFLIPTPISFFSMREILLEKDIENVSCLKFFVTETPKVARSFLKDLPLKNKIQDITIYQFDEHSDTDETQDFLKPLLVGEDMGLISDAGIPSVADPGFHIVREAQKLGVKVIPLVGPSSIILALMSSGLNGQNFTFNGYLPKEQQKKRKRIKTLERLALETNQTQIFMEPPYRNQSIYEDILDVCEDTTYLCVAFDIMGPDEKILTKRVGEWKQETLSLEKKPCLFLIGK